VVCLLLARRTARREGAGDPAEQPAPALTR